MRRRPYKKRDDTGPSPEERARMLAETGTARVSSLKPVRNDPTRFTVVVDRERMGRVSADDLAALGLSVGALWTADLADKVLSAADLTTARRRALNIIAYRPRTRAELARRLSRHSHAPDTIERVLDELESRGFLDDAALAARAAENEVARKPAGPRLLVAKLRARGINEATAREAARSATEQRDLTADAFALAERRLRTMPAKLDVQARRRRLFAALARRGFDPETARDATDRAIRGSLPDADGSDPD